MGKFTEALSAQQGPAADEIGALCKKLDSFIHAPTNLKEVERMAAFAGNAELLQAVDRFLLEYFESHDHFRPEPGGYTGYEVIPAWYSVALLLQSETEQPGVSRLIRQMLADESPDLSLARRMLSLKHSPAYAELAEAVESRFREKNAETEVYRWAAAIGLELPESFDWEFYFVLGATPDPGRAASHIQLNHLAVSVRARAPKGDGESYEIQLRDRQSAVKGWWRDQDTDAKIRFMGIAPEVELSEKPSLLNFMTFLGEIEGLFGLRFDRKLSSSYFSKGIRRRNAVQKWLDAAE